jgi:hypothetical protein
MRSSLLILAVLLVLLWFALGTGRNVRKGNQLLSWLQGGLPLLGRRTTLRWLGSSAVRLEIVDPRPPFREAEVVVVLEPRDVGLLWAWARARRRRDFLILRARLERSPRFELVAADLRGWTGRDALRDVDPEAWTFADFGDPSIRAAHGPGAEPDATRRLWDRLAGASGGVWRLSIRRTPPHLEVHLLPPDTATVAAERLIGTVTEVARAASSP